VSISISCPKCLRPYRLKDKFAGKVVKCRDCRYEFAVPSTQPPAKMRTKAGDPVYRHEAKEKNFQFATEQTPFFEAISKHIDRTIGPCTSIFHELVSDRIHLDLHIVPPSGEKPSEAHPLGTNHYTIVTSGMSTLPMNLPSGTHRDGRFAELMVALPADWPGMGPDGQFDDERMKDEANWWPIRWLKHMARFPHDYDTNLGIGHTVPTDDPPAPFDDTTKQCCVLIGPPLLSPDSSRLVINDDVVINFYAIWPIYLEEMNCKLEYGYSTLAAKFDEIELFELIDPRRKNVCRRGFWPFGRR
jgi:hypothetical protein